MGHRSDAEFIGMLARLASDMPKAGRARLATCIVHKGQVASFGFNQMKSHPFQARFGRNSDSIFLHSETDAIKNALRVLTTRELERSTMYVCRIKKPNPRSRTVVMGLARPCEGCARAISTFGIRKVVWTLDDGGFACTDEGHGLGQDPVLQAA
jgi:tRNA(Arg) A34 adenosine deaminase TadA